MTSAAPSPGSWRSSAWQAALVLVVVAAAARIVWALLEPLLPVLAVVLILIGICSLLVRRPR